ncbi:hypothetical protein [Cerasicoccus frondis]|uniref:hypothetical protein n=1 Tax=Cerasicoccus frondis TaxID=490090 RepID=UPI002852762B|nr:hypothetical protein [Cerasicoccus frondis]
MAFISIIPLAALGALSATPFSETYTLGQVIPDNSPTGFSDTQFIDAPSITSIETLEIELVLSGGWIGDLYGYVQHDSGFTVLVNRLGRTESEPFGSSASALNVTFTADGPDIHVSDAPYTGIFGPDARTTDPDTLLDTDPRVADFSSFIGLPASGNWTLFLADVSPGETTTVDSWSLSITGVPEPQTSIVMLGLAAGAVVLTRAYMRQRRKV